MTKKQAALYLNQLEDAATRIELTHEYNIKEVKIAVEACYLMMREFYHQKEKEEQNEQLTTI